MRLVLVVALVASALAGAHAQGAQTQGAYAQGGATARPRNTRLPLRRTHPCEKSSCYPATGNLLIGRESRLSASSTCGMHSQERYCIVSHLEERKKCFWCDSRPQTERNPGLNHRVSNIIYRFHPGTRHRTWWQSRNGIENVTLQLDLEAEFHFTHLVIVFKTFRPAAMLVERSFDFGKTWRVYRYFAYNCDESFPGVPRRNPNSLTDVVCESRYSSVAPSFDGEIIFRVLPPNINVGNPYSQEVQNLLKMTNLRINFTKLHTLGDDLLDNRAEIQEKYYYAINDMTVRGSCSCYGHASRCLPLPGVDSKNDMVHGRCECTHNTKGLNCELCEDFYNDLPWKPALGKTTNACKRCTCNNHATSCHFDSAVYELTAHVSGGVCDDCQHNTMGRNCEQCKAFFYKDPEMDLEHPEICKPCDCDPRGSLDDAICDSVTDAAGGLEAGRCHCKVNVDGRRCDTCKNGFWNFEENNPDGCQACSCNPLGTVDNQGCDTYTGECTCKRNVIGRDCNQCLPEHWGLAEEEDGCQRCECDFGGSLDNNCDIVTGQCRCRPNTQGRRCEQPMQHFFAGALDNLVFEAEAADCNTGTDYNVIYNNCQVSIREPFRDGREDSWTGTGFMKVFEGDHIEFTIDDIVTSMDYDIVIRYEPQISGDWEQIEVKLDRLDALGLDSLCANSLPQDDLKSVVLPDNARSAVVNPPTCLEAGKTYKLHIDFIQHQSNEPNARASVLLDSVVLVPRVTALPFFNNNTPTAEAWRRNYEMARCGDAYYYTVNKNDIPEICKQYHTSVGFYVFNGALSCKCDPTGSTSYKCDEYGGVCPCKSNVVGRNCNRCASGTYGFGPEGCKSCDCSNIGSLNNFCDTSSGQCKCKPNTYGRQCDECQPGYWNFPNCQQCECHGHADECDPKTGACTDCRDYSFGHRCDRCMEGYYGDPRLGYDIPCRACPCPGTLDSMHSFAPRCDLDPMTKDVICECQKGYAGSRCDVCADNYFGHPEKPGGSCEECNCSKNVDVTKPGNCNPHTGKCLQCLYHTDGDSCEMCQAGYFGDAEERTCTECVCELLGTNSTKGPCDRITGQCSCYKNVIGQSCDGCIENHWRLASGEGCDPCECDSIGSVSEQCNVYDGQCNCKSGFGGRQCNQCQTNYWGDPNDMCQPCECDDLGSAKQQCHHNTGACVCHPGIGGHKCDECARGYLGNSPSCSPCGECFDNWDRIIMTLHNETNNAISNASKIKIVGATGAYTREFEEMENNLNNIEKIIEDSTVGKTQIEGFENKVDDVKQSLDNANKTVMDLNLFLSTIATRINLANASVDGVLKKYEKLQEETEQLNVNARKLQEANVEGALNLTREAKQRAMNAADNADETQKIIKDTERRIKNTDLVVERQTVTFNETQKENDESIRELQEEIKELQSRIPELNAKMCGNANSDCDLCGGAGCGRCGGLSCDQGAMTKADKALEFANKTEALIRKNELAADDLSRGIAVAKKDTAASLAIAEDTYNSALAARNLTDDLNKNSSNLIRDLKEFLASSGGTPADVRALANSILNLTIVIKPDEIQKLSDDISDTVSQVTNIESIIEETRQDLEESKELKEKALAAKENATATLEIAKNVVLALKDASSAQIAAEDAIKKANNDIESAERDLVPIESETDVAQKKANETMDKVTDLKKKLENLQKNILSIDSDSRLVRSEAEDVVYKADAAEQQARELRQKYTSANSTLTKHAEKSANARERAQLLLDQATKLAAHSQEQLKQLQNMEVFYNSHIQDLNDREIRIGELNDQVGRYLSAITAKSDYYRSCSA
ncbi:laminin subunit beta-1 [Arctopsyche grandis]|uniref:laminin subunit beta-1 n=1 Tax=Arctopsyche grandis TaxID=121162 RepID=UPI00406D8C2B